MATCAFDKAIGYQITSFSQTVGAATPASIPDVNNGNVYTTLDVTNDTNVDIKVSYSTDGGMNNTFIVPTSVKVKGRRIASGVIINNSVTISSTTNTVIVGKVTINAGN